MNRILLKGFKEWKIQIRISVKSNNNAIVPVV